MSRLLKLVFALVLTASTSLVAVPAGAAVLSQNTSVSLNGSPAIGGTISSLVENQPEGATLSYKWVLGTATVGTESSLLISNNAWAGKKVRLSVTSVAPGYKTYKYSSPLLNIGSFTVFSYRPTFPTAKAGTIQSTFNVLQTFPTYFDVDGRSQVTYSYQWSLDGQPIDGATSSELLPTDDMIGKRLRATQTLHFPGLPDKNLQLDFFTVTGEFTSNAPGAISGESVVGQTISLMTTPSYVPSGTSVRYNWLRNGSAIKGATKSTYKLTSSDWHKTISLRVTTSRANYIPVVTEISGNYIFKEVTKTGSVMNGYDAWQGYEGYNLDNVLCMRSGTNAKWFGCINDIQTEDDLIYISLQMTNPAPVNAALLKWKVKVVGVSSIELDAYGASGNGSEYVSDSALPYIFRASSGNKDTTWTTDWKTEAADYSGKLNLGLVGFDSGALVIKSVQLTAYYRY